MKEPSAQTPGGLIGRVIQRSRATLLCLVFIFIAGIVAFIAIPKEANPDVAIPMVYVSANLEGVSPEDSERLLIKPLEQELQAIEGLKELRATAVEGHASVILEFDAGFDADRALDDVREKVDTAKTLFPEEADEPKVIEINVSLFPVISVGLSGPLSQRELVVVARRLKDAIERIPEVLKVEIGGDREELLEILVDPQVMASYGIDNESLATLVARNNSLVAAGSLDTGAGRFSVKVPGVIEDIEDLMVMPIKSVNGQVVTFADVATVQRTFKDPTGFARIDGEPALVLEISKRTGANILLTSAKVHAVVDQARELLPDGVQIQFNRDEADSVNDILHDLLNNVLAAVALVTIVIIATMGVRSAILVGITIPGSFLAGILVLAAMGVTLNIVVLFSLILVAGMLVDGAIVVSELADRHLADGQTPAQAWGGAAQRMAWPIIASTATTIVVFLPLLFWPGVVGQFMSYLPLTVMVCLLASLVMALLFLPVMGSVVGRSRTDTESDLSGRGTQVYRRVLGALLRRPGLTLLGSLAVITVIYVAYARFNHGMEFFPSVEPDSAQIVVRARGDLSVLERDRIVREVEQKLTGLSEVESVYARSLLRPESRLPADTVGLIQLTFLDWEERRPAVQIIQDLRKQLASIPGVVLEFRESENGPAAGKPIELRVRADDNAVRSTYVDQIIAAMSSMEGFVDIEDDRSLPGIEWRTEVDRQLAARYGTDILSAGSTIRLFTNGVKLATYRPPDVNDEVDIIVRLPESSRSLEQLQRQTMDTPMGQVPLSEFVRFEPGQRTGSIERVDSQRATTVKSDLAPGFQAERQLQLLMDRLPPQPDGLSIDVGGENEDQKETGEFLGGAFLIALGLMLLILLIQFNSFYQTLLILSAIALSTAGVLLGLLLNAQPFGMVMVGMGIIALAGIVVNNNIILIDTYNLFRRTGMEPYAAALETGALRLRPVLLTAGTTVLGLIPMMLSINVNLLEPSLGLNAPSTQWWTQLSSAIAGGLAFATFLTLLLTPALLVLGDRWRKGKR